MRLKDKVAVVTGGTSGIGRAIVARFAAEGAAVYFSGRREALGAKVAQDCGATFVRADVRVEADAARTIEAARAHSGRIDVLVNNAGGVVRPARLQAIDLDSFDEMLAVHLRGAVAHLKHVSALMRAQRSGSIINIASVAGHRAGYASSLGYSVAKAALLHLTRCAAIELGEDNVRVNSISPGGIATGIYGKAIGLDSQAADAKAAAVGSELATMQAIPRAGLPEDVAAAALYLASDEAGFVNGEDILVDGGLIAGRRVAEIVAQNRALRALLE